MDVRGKLRELREKAAGSPTQEQVADAAGLEQREYVSRFESGKKSPTVIELEMLLRYYGVTLAEFFEAKIPSKFAKQAHADLHDQLQIMLEEGDAEMVAALTFTIQNAYLNLDEHRKAKPPGKKS